MAASLEHPVKCETIQGIFAAWTERRGHLNRYPPPLFCSYFLAEPSLPKARYLSIGLAQYACMLGLSIAQPYILYLFRYGADNGTAGFFSTTRSLDSVGDSRTSRSTTPNRRQARILPGDSDVLNGGAHRHVNVFKDFPRGDAP